MIEFDKDYFTVESTKVEQAKAKRGPGATGKRNVSIMAESTSLQDVDTDKKSNKARYCRTKVLQVHTAKEINQIVLENIDDKTIVFSD